VSLFDVTQDAVDRCGDNADQVWLDAAEAAVLHVARMRPTWTTDDVWPLLDGCREPRALGAVLRRLSKQGVIVKTGEWRESVRESRHNAPVTVWRLA
jgi:hypothetical protein